MEHPLDLGRNVFAYRHGDDLWTHDGCYVGRFDPVDDSVGALLQHLEDIGEADNTIVIFTIDNSAECSPGRTGA